jgi:hypothetical protein
MTLRARKRKKQREKTVDTWRVHGALKKRRRRKEKKKLETQDTKTRGEGEFQKRAEHNR